MTVLLKPNAPLCGVSGRMVKLAASELHRMRSARLWDLAVILGARPEVVEPLWELLKKAGCIEEVEGWWRPTDAMQKLAQARIGKPIARSKAEQLLTQTIENAERANDLENGPLYYVTRVAVFGSFVDESRENLGDLDVGYELLERPGCENTISHMICCNEDPLSHIRGLIRPKHPAVRLLDWGTMERLKCRFRVVMEMRGKRCEEAKAHAMAEAQRYREEAAALEQLMKESMVRLRESPPEVRQKKRGVHVDDRS